MASREVRVGDVLRVRNDSGDFDVEVLIIRQVYGPAAIAQMLYPLDRRRPRLAD